MAAKVVCFISEKGGVGKTTAIYHIAIGLRRRHNRKILVVDADYQRGGVTGRLLPELLEHFKKGSIPGMTLFHVFQALYSGMSDLPEPDILKTSQQIRLMPSDPRLTTVSSDKLPTAGNIRDNNELLFVHLAAIRTVLEPHLDSHDFILIDTHPETSELLRSVIYASDYAISPVKLDEQSSVGVPSAIEAINRVNSDVTMLQHALGVGDNFTPTKYIGAIGMMAREWGEELKRSERSQYRRLSTVGGMFKNYITEGDGIRKAAELRLPVYDIPISNAKKQSAQFEALVDEFLTKCP